MSQANWTETRVSRPVGIDTTIRPNAIPSKLPPATQLLQAVAAVIRARLVT